MRIGIIELLVDKRLDGPLDGLYGLFLRKQFVSIGPQAVAVWCRQLGHEVTYTTYWGQRDPRSLLPSPLDVVFIATYTPSSALAYALAKLFRREKTLTVIGGPHAKAFPDDCLRFFDVVVKECDKRLIDTILRGDLNLPAVVTSGRSLTEIPSVEERRAEIEQTAFIAGKPRVTGFIPMLASVGCPYSCNFCMDWDNPYVALPKDQLQADLRYVSRHWPDAFVAYHDPNFAVRFDEIMDIIETLPEEQRTRYVMESSLAILKESLLHRLRATNCVYVAPGIESWDDYSNKAGSGSKMGRAKLEHIVRHIDLINEYVPGMQTNHIFGTDGDKGSEPVDLTREFVRRLPRVWPTLNIPIPFGGTPLQQELLAEGRVLKAMPFGCYKMPYLNIILKHYDPITYYDHMIAIQEEASSRQMLARRLGARSPPAHKFIAGLRTLAMRSSVRKLREVRTRLATDSQLLAFQEGRSTALPEFYFRKVTDRIGRYAELLSRVDLTPLLPHTETIPARLVRRA